jgi:signal transduction histidine kinase/CheY-like chemotaxis protein
LAGAPEVSLDRSGTADGQAAVAARTLGSGVADVRLEELLGTLRAVLRGDLHERVAVAGDDVVAEICGLFNDIADRGQHLTEALAAAGPVIADLGASTRANEEQAWLKSSLARVRGLLHGHSDAAAMARVVLGELAPLVGAQHGAFFAAESADGPVTAGDAEESVRLRMIAGYAVAYDPAEAPSYAMGQTLVGQAAAQRRTIQVTGTRAGYVRVASGTGWSEPASVIVLPLPFGGRVLGVLELAAVGGFGPVHRELLEEIRQDIGTALNTLAADSRAEALLRESRRLAEELQACRRELEASEARVEEKAGQLARQNRDIEAEATRIEQTGATLRERARQLAGASKATSEFTADLSHELRTPLHSLLILAGLLAANSEGNLSPRQVDFARTIHSAGSDLLRLINDLLDLSNIGAGRMEVRAQRLPLTAIADYVSATFQPSAARKDLELTTRITPGTPDHLTTDEQRVQQILRNLLSNAVKFTDHGAVALEIATDPADPAMLEFAVRDTGTGIAAEELQLIFEAFPQADGTAGRQCGGTGLGLSISRELALLLGGDLRVESTPGEGSTFTLRLPVEPARPGGGEPRRAHPAGRHGPADHPVVLVVEPSGSRTLREAADAAVDALAGLKDHLEVVPAHSRAQADHALSTADVISVLLHLGAGREVVDAVLGGAESLPDTPVLLYEPENDDGAAEQLRAAHGGRARVEIVRSVAQTMERLTLRLLTGLPKSADLLLAAQEPRQPAARFNGEKVLVIDDDVRNVFALTSALELHGLSVLHADSGRRGVEMLNRHDDVRLVLMDQMMPGMDGYATTARIRGLPRFADLPIIAVTAKAMRGDREEGPAAGTNEHMTKPVDVDGLLDLIRTLIEPPGDAGP